MKYGHDYFTTSHHNNIIYRAKLIQFNNSSKFRKQLPALAGLCGIKQGCGVLLHGNLLNVTPQD